MMILTISENSRNFLLIWLFTFCFCSIATILPQLNMSEVNHAQKKALTTAPNETSLCDLHEESWRKNAIQIMWQERRRMAYTPIINLNIGDALILLKNESASHTESLKHRYSWALVMWALLEGLIRSNTTVYEASSGNTARSEAYFCKLIGVKFVTVLTRATELDKIQKIEREGGLVKKAASGNILELAKKSAEDDANGFFINQFGNSDRALEYHDSGNFPQESVSVIHEMFQQLRPSNIFPTHFVMSAATGGTISSIGRFAKKYGLSTEIVLADTEFSAYYDLVTSGRFINGTEDPMPFWVAPGIAGTGYGWAGKIYRGKTSSLTTSVIDRVLKIPDLASTACMQILQERYGVDGGPSTGVNFAAALWLIASRNAISKQTKKEPIPIVIGTLVADNGINYRSSYFNSTWIDREFKKAGGLWALKCWKRILEKHLKNLESFDVLSDGNPIIKGSQSCKK